MSRKLVVSGFGLSLILSALFGVTAAKAADIEIGDPEFKACINTVIDPTQ